MRWLVVIVCGVGPLAVCGAGLGLWPVQAAQREASQPRSASELLPDAAPLIDWTRFVGAGSCASVACHGSQQSDQPAWRQSYQRWCSDDAHANAFLTLYGERSKRIVQLLDGLERPDLARPYEDARCLSCHTAFSAAPPQRRDLLVDGVSCEACHGPARDWLVPHAGAGWKRLSADQKQARFGFIDTKDLVARVGQCAGCHVGEPAGASHPGREVNHDMIAAGHPRLMFELSSHLARMPAHWDRRADLRRYPDLDARTWSIGQVLAAESALELLAARAAAAEGSGAAISPLAPVWPEFAEQDCYTCHQPLRDPLAYGGARLSALAAQRRASVPRMNTWYVALAPHWRGLSPQASQRLATDVAGLQSALGRALPSARQAHQHASQAAATLRQARAAAAQPWDRAAVEAALKQLASAAGDNPPTTWDTAAQTYLALVALEVARQQLRRGDAIAPTAAELALRRQLSLLHQALRFGDARDERFDGPAVDWIELTERWRAIDHLLSTDSND
jgi:hypothetical protein